MKTNSFFARFAAALFAAGLLAALAGCNAKTGGDVMATVDGRKILKSDVDSYYENQVASAQQAPTGEQERNDRQRAAHRSICIWKPLSAGSRTTLRA